MRKLISALCLSLAAIASGNSNAIVVTLDDSSLSVVRPTSGTTVVDFTGSISFTPGYQFVGVVLLPVYSAEGNVITSVFSDTGPVIISIIVSASDELGHYAFTSFGSDAFLTFGECLIGGGGCNNFDVTYSLDVVGSAAPEPASSALFAMALAGLVYVRRRPRTFKPG